MITENKLGDCNKCHVDDVPANLQQKDVIPFADLYISENVTDDTFVENDKNNSNENCKNLLNDQPPTITPSCRTGLSILMDLPLKIMNGVSDLLNFQSFSTDPEIPPKRSYSPRPHHAKQTPTDIARGRGRGRGRSQLRRSGVSQTRHRQERIRQRLSADIQDDLKGLSEFEDLGNLEDELTSSTPCVDENGAKIRYGADGIETETSGSSRFPFLFGYCDTRRMKRKKGNKNGNEDPRLIKNNCKVRYIPECSFDVVKCKRADDCGDMETQDSRTNRKRLQSDRSVDSEDSYCIVFETGSEESDYETDYDYTTDDDDDDDDDCESELKVRFSPHTTIHTMITWDYAYRAARRGPWEQMARDRERFKYRINCIAKVLDPVLVPQHRSEIWQRRFAVEI